MPITHLIKGKSEANKNPVSVSEAGQSEIFEHNVLLSDAWEHSNIKIVAIVQQFQSEGSDHPITQAQTRNINDLDPDPDGDELTYLYELHILHHHDNIVP